MRIAEKKKSQITALYEQCSNLPADVRSCLENGYFTVTVPPPWNMSNQKTAQEVQDKIKEWSRQYTCLLYTSVLDRKAVIEPKQPAKILVKFFRKIPWSIQKHPPTRCCDFLGSDALGTQPVRQPVRPDVYKRQLSHL